MAEINIKAKLLVVTLIAIFSAEPSSVLLSIEIAGFAFSYLLGLFFFKSTPFKSVPYVILGAFIGIVLDIIIFPTVDGVERNLFPIEIAIHVLIATVLSYGLAFVSLLILKFKNRKV